MRQEMTQESCGCDRFDRLDGAAAEVYILRFLERSGEDEERGATYYRCRYCSRDWKRTSSEGASRPAICRLPSSENV